MPTDSSTSLIVESKLIPVSTLLLFFNIKASVSSSSSEAVHIAFESPRVNCRHASMGRIKHQGFVKEYTRKTKFVFGLCRRVDDLEPSNADIPGGNIFSADNATTGCPHFDFSVNIKDACFPLFVLSLALPIGGQLNMSDYSAEYDKCAKKVALRSQGNHSFFSLNS